MTTPTALIIDFGGVLTTDLWDSVRNCTYRMGFPDNVIIDLIHNDPDIAPRFADLERGTIDQHDLELLLAAKASVPAAGLLAAMCADLRPDQTMIDTITELRTSGVPVAILSNSWGAGYFSPYDGYNLDQIADVIVFSHLVGLRKPEPEIFTLTADKLGKPATECVFIDDTARYLPAAAALGMTTIHHTNPATTINELNHLFDSKRARRP